ncbi:MAG: hypothetical protein DMG51_03330 [Acidobacteria bacterium]|nr:MAG: hypothetical protein DMG51_03330 [Acidobacteriota bacterium]
MKYPVLAQMRRPLVSIKRSVGLAILLLACRSLAFSQIQEGQVEPISSALRAGEFDKAVELSRVALKASPSNAQLWTLQGIAYAGKGDGKEALTSFQRALKISPNNIAALAGAAQIEYQEGNQSAMPLLNHLLQLRPADPTAHAMLAVLEYRQGHCGAAVPHFEKAGQLLDTQLDALHALATCLVRLKRLDGAAATFQRAVALHPDDRREPLLLDPRNVSLYLDFANICFAHESFQVGVDVISEGLMLQPSAEELYVARGVLYAQLAQYDKAEADFEKAYDLNPNQSLSAAAQGLVAVQANDLDHALASIQSKLARNPNDPLLLYLQADVLSQKGVDPGTPEFQLAMRSARRAVTLQPALAAARAVLAKMYMQTGAYKEAIEQCRKALTSDPKDQTAVYRLIQALRKTGQKKEIPELLQRLAQLREQATQEERERYRYKLFEQSAPGQQPTQP